MKVFVVGIALACAGTGLTQWALTHQHVQVQAAPSSIPDKPDADTSGQSDSVYVPKSIPFDAATYNMNSLPHANVDGPDPAKLWDSWDGDARAAEGWDGTSPSLPGLVAISTGSKGATSGASKSAGTGSTSKAGTAKTGTTAKAPSVTAARVPQGTKGKLATPQTLSQGPSVKPVKVPLY